MFRDPPHFLKPLTSTSTPRRLLWLHVSSMTYRERGALVERWQAGVLGTTHWTSRRRERKDTEVHYLDAGALWEAADRFCIQGRRHVLWAHDLAFQLRVSRALIELPRLGWHLERIVLERTAAWALFRKGSSGLMCCDLRAWIPKDLLHIARQVDSDSEGRRARLSAGRGRTLGRTESVAVVRGAVLDLLDWISGENLGPFKPTGSGQSFAAFRRRFHKHRLLVHDDMGRLQAERRAMWTGRCEAWRHGHLRDGPYVEYDLHCAYATIGRDFEIPAIATGVVHKPTRERIIDLIEKHAVLAEITVETDIPVVPTAMGTRTVWPVGRFHTVLWDPEILLALEYAEKVTFHRAWKYKRAPALHDFCAWVLDHLDGQTQIYGPAGQMALKHWSRCLVGRMGLRFRSWERFGEQDPPDLRLVTYLDIDDGVRTDMLVAGRDRLILTELAEATESLPQIPGWIMSQCRRQLWGAMGYVGLDQLAYVDTDSIVFPAQQGRNHRQVDESLTARGWVLKGTHRTLTIHGPRNLVLENERRVSGLPLSAQQTAPLEFDGTVMRSIRESLKTGQLDHVANIPRTFRFHTPDLRRQHNADGRTSPYRLELQ